MVRNLIASVSLIALLGSISYGDTTSETPPIIFHASEPAETIIPPQISPTLSLDALAPVVPEKQGGMDPVVRRIYLSMVTPSAQPTLSANGGFLLSTIESYTVNDEGVKPISCSLRARRTLAALLDTYRIYAPSIAQGDANDLIRFGRLNNTLQSFFEKDVLLSALDERRDTSFETVFDVYRHVSSRSYAFQGHRATVFLGEDNLWYILDPLDGEKTTKPQLFSTYMENDIEDAEWLVRFPGYSRLILEAEHLSMILPFLSPEVQLFFQPDYLIMNDTDNDGNESEILTDGVDLLTVSEAV